MPRFGLFVHWGIYSLLADGEWVMNNRSIRTTEYEHLAARFNPTRFDARAWVALARRAGVRYLTMTTKHHDGFAMYDSRLSDWDIVDRTPFGRDVIAELAAPTISSTSARWPTAPFSPSLPSGLA